MNENEHIEEPLLALVSEGNQGAFTLLFRKYSKLLYSFLYEHTDSAELADDLVQDIFSRLWVARESLPNIKKFRSFLFVMARNHAFNEIKKRIRERQRINEWSASQTMNEDDTYLQEMDARINIIDEAVAQLPEQQQKAWIMSRRKGMKHSEIASEMNLSKETVKKYIQYANTAIMKYVVPRMYVAMVLLFLKNF